MCQIIICEMLRSDKDRPLNNNPSKLSAKPITHVISSASAKKILKKL